jgi:class 3 adenylate cyclase
MRCTSCKAENPEHAKFCLECGAGISHRCAACGAELPRTAKFCLECGKPIGVRSAPPAPDPRAYTPKHLAVKILQSKSALEGERKQVTVLFADVKGSMDLAGQVDPEEWHKIMDRFFAILSEGVHRFEGTINQYTGDGIMALFGAPIAHEDHAERAGYAALISGTSSAPTRTSYASGAASTSRCAWGSTRAKLSSARSARICAWTTPRRD